MTLNKNIAAQIFLLYTSRLVGHEYDIVSNVVNDMTSDMETQAFTQEEINL